MYDKLLSEQYSHTFELTLDQAYCDGHKLYYSYTLKRSAPMAATYGEGEPTGDFNYMGGGRQDRERLHDARGRGKGVV